MADQEKRRAGPPPFDPKTRCVKTKGGKMYLPVAERVLWMNADREEYGYEVDIRSEVVYVDAERAVVKSTVTIPGRGTATGIKSETKAGFAAYVEKASTGSIGRALAILGYGTELALELWEEDMQAGGDVSAAADSPLATAPAATSTTSSAPAATATAGRTVSTNAGGATVNTARIAKTRTDAERMDIAKAEVSRLAKEHGYPPPASYGALVRMARDQYGFELPAIKKGQVPTPGPLEALVAHMTRLGGDPAKDGAVEAKKETKEEGAVPASPFEGAAPEADPARREVKYRQIIDNVLRVIGEYQTRAEIDDIMRAAEEWHKQGYVRDDDMARIRQRHRERSQQSA